MKYNYIVSIFLLLLVVIISQSFYENTNKQIVEGFCWFRCRRSRNNNNNRNFIIALQKEAAERMRLYIIELRRPRGTPYVNLLYNAYVKNQTYVNEQGYKQAQNIDNTASNTQPCNSDKDIGKIIHFTSQSLNDTSTLNSTKVYFLSEVLNKALGHFSVYDTKNAETQFNYLGEHFPNTFNDDENVKNKYMKFCNLLALVQVAKSTTSSALPPDSILFNGGDKVNKDGQTKKVIGISQPIIDEAKELIKEFMKIKYALTEEEEKEIKNKYQIIVK